MMIGPQMKYMCGFLNSKLAHWYLSEIAPTSGMGVTRWKKAYLECLPLANASSCAKMKISRLVDEAKSAHRNDNLIERIESRIDSLVYEFYGLNEFEKAVINSSEIP